MVARIVPFPEASPRGKARDAAVSTPDNDAKPSSNAQRLARAFALLSEQEKRRIERLLSAGLAEQQKTDRPLHEAIAALHAMRTSMSEAQYLQRIDEALDQFAPPRH